MRFVTIQEWRDIEGARLVKAKTRIKCLHCGGEKLHEGRCDCCDHVCEHECDECDENGDVLFADLSPWDRDRYLTVQKYEEAVLTDASLLAAWIVRDLTEVLVDSGFTPWQSVIYHLKQGVVTGFRGGDLHLSTSRR